MLGNQAVRWMALLDHASFRLAQPGVGAGSPANQAARWMAPASPVFAGKPAPTTTALDHTRLRLTRPVAGAGLPANQAALACLSGRPFLNYFNLEFFY
ncbi:hypothetical protein YSA_02231 [Pseudomonas putida ND6]|jgi:hypothetical protein|uniref:Uncharacterized protein n=1 Tax=Pseudomonas putida ND6 TaxID=231023 RepID=I3UR53_PSEPU|nr:hypothetical protein YSA_02231 [Pseudomonas putida ND6]